MHIDGKNQPYITVDNLRVTRVRKTGDKDWAEIGNYLSFRATMRDGNRVMMGPEMPVRKDNVAELIRAIRKLSK
ncbi:MAG: hypothetical protein ABSG70_03470 [Terriglobales bacterium]|jgi:hypothetical protein